MALEALKDVKEIDGFDVNNYDKTMDIKEYLELGTKPFIEIHHGYNRILFKIQDGPIKENGVNGCNLDTILSAVKAIVEVKNKKNKSTFFDDAIDSLEAAIGDLILHRRENGE